MSESCCRRSFRADAPRRAALLAVFALALAGCGSTAKTKAASHPPASASQPPASASQPLASAPAGRSGPRLKPGTRGTSARGTAATKPAPVAATACPADEKRTATGLCYSPAAQTKLVAKLGPCPAGQVVADNGACQPLTSRGANQRPSLPARCRRPHRAGCAPQGSLQGGFKPRGPSFDPVFH